MYAIADTRILVADGTLNEAQARAIEAGSRSAMVKLAINAILMFGILAATGGLIFWLGTPLSVSLAGAVFLAAGYLLLSRTSAEWSMFGNAAALIGAGLLIGGATAELLDKYEDIAGPVLTGLGGSLALGLSWLRLRYARLAPFVFGTVLAMAVAMHLTGVYFWAEFAGLGGWPVPVIHAYAATVVVALGWHLDVRLVTALAIVPLAQMLDTGTFYAHAMYAFYSPESTLTIVQMAVLIAGCLYLAARVAPRHGRHALILAMMAFVVANLSALVGSLWGDYVGETLTIGHWKAEGQTWQEFRDAQEAWQETALYISDNAYSVLWGIALAAMIIWSAFSNRRGLFNASMTFAGIHAYTQLFETYADEPLAYVIGGLGAIGLAWGVWRANQILLARTQA